MTAVDVTCPKCQSKLKLDEAPAADELIECPKCEHQFAPAAPPPPKKELPTDLRKPAGKKGAKGKGKKGAEPGKRKGVKKKKTNPLILTLMIGGAFVILACVAGIGYYVLGSSGKIVEMLSYVPAEANVVRGCNVGLIARFPGYMPEAKKQTDGVVDDCVAVLAPAAGQSKEDFLDYMMVAKVRGQPAGTVVVLRSRVKFDPNTLATALGTNTPMNGMTCVRTPGKAGAMNNAAVLIPSDRTIVVVLAGGGQNQFLQAAASGGPKNNANTLAGKMKENDAFWKITKGHIWQMVICQGDMSGYNKEMAASVEKAFKNAADQIAKAKVLGLWMSFGVGGYKLGGAIDCDSAETASTLRDAFNTGPISKGDDSEVPRDLSTAVSFSGSREFKPYFLGNIKFLRTGTCAYFESKVIKEKVQQMAQTFNNPAMGDRQPGGGGGRGPIAP